jgi:GNAT superfamily N-acetyltransferase
MSAGGDPERRIAEAYRWHRRLGARVIETPHCHVVADPAHPDVWDANHVDEVTASTFEDIEAVLAAMHAHLAHTNWRVAHTDGFTPDPFLARLAFDDYKEQFVAIQMALDPSTRPPLSPCDLRLVDSDEDWLRLARLVRLNHEEGHVTGGLVLPPAFSDQVLAGYRAKSPLCRFHLVFVDGEAIAYGAKAAAPNGVGMIEDLFTHPGRRRRGVASAMIAAFADDLRRRGCDTVFLGALVDEQAKRLYAKLGFRPVAVARCWVKEVA